MAQKFLGIIQTFSQNELIDFLRKNGHEEFEETFLNAEITDGETFLNINELQMIKWRLPPTEKRKLMTFLTQIKENPQKFVGESEKRTNVSRRQSFVTHNSFRKKIEETPQNFPGESEHQTDVTRHQSQVSQNNFKKKLEQVIIAPKPCQIKPARKPAPPPKPVDEVNDEDSLPTEDYLPMDRGVTENLDAHYDESGYLVPLDRSNPVEENDYEPPPSVHNFGFPKVGNTTPVTARPPQTLPRGSTDERGYILQLNQEQPPPVLPRGQQNQRNVSVRPKLDTPSPTVKAPPKFNAFFEKDNESEEDEYDQPDNLGSSQKLNIDMNTGFNKFISLFRKEKKNVPNNDENSDTISITSKRSIEQIETPKESSFMSKSWEREYTLKDRPLPPLPERNHNPPVQENVQFTSAKIYVNVMQQVRSETMGRSAPSNRKTESSNLLYPQAHATTRKSKSENDLSKEDENNAIYNNVDEEKEVKPKPPESYEHYVVQEQDAKQMKRPLPLPPRNLPQVQIDPSLVRNNCDDDEESEEYFNFIQNLNNEPFYRNTDRKGARLLLTDLGEGAFLFRPSKQYFLALSLKHNEKYFNLGIEKTPHNKIRLHTEGDNMSPEFSSLREFADHFATQYLTFEHQGKVVQVMLRKILPKNRF